VIHPSEEQSKEAQRGDISPLESIGTFRLPPQFPMVGPWVAGPCRNTQGKQVMFAGGSPAKHLERVAGGKGLERKLPSILSKPQKLPVAACRQSHPWHAAKQRPEKLEAAKTTSASRQKSFNEGKTEYAQKVTDALPELQRIAQDNKGKIKTPRTSHTKRSMNGYRN